MTAKHVVNANGTLEVTEDTNNKNATLMRQVHIHHALRCMAGIKNHQLSHRYPLFKTSDFPLPVLPKAPGWETA